MQDTVCVCVLLQKRMGASQSITPESTNVTAAEMFMCGRDIESCRSIVVPKQVKQLIFEDKIYKEKSIGEAMLKVMQVIHKGRGCIYPNTLYFEIETGRVYVTLHRGRGSKEVEARFDKQEFASFVKKCKPSQRAIAVRIGFEGHANMLIFNKVQKTLEHFEPHGDSAFHLSKEENEKLAQMINDTFLCSDCAFSDYSYVPPSAACPMITMGSGTLNTEFGEMKTADGAKLGLQAILNMSKGDSHASGTCVMWSLWYMHVRLLHPDVPPSDMMEKAMSMAFDSSAVSRDAYIETLKGDDFCSKRVRDDMRACKKDDEVREKCAPQCATLLAIENGGGTLENFIVQFTQQVISQINIEIERKKCLVMDVTKDGKREICYDVPPLRDDAQIVVYTAHMDILERARMMLQARRRLHPTLDFIVHRPLGTNFKWAEFLSAEESSEYNVAMVDWMRSMVYFNGKFVKFPLSNGTPFDNTLDALYSVLVKVAPIPVYTPPKRAYALYMYDETDEHIVSTADLDGIVQDKHVELMMLNEIYNSEEDIKKVTSLMPSEATAAVLKGADGAAFFDGKYIGLGLSAIMKHVNGSAAEREAQENTYTATTYSANTSASSRRRNTGGGKRRRRP
jgi:hypothetical protein